MRTTTKTAAILVLVVLLLQLQVRHVSSDCNTCSVASNMACLSLTTFQVCVNGSPTGPVNSCPGGHVCSTVDAYICKQNAADVVIACSNCNTCDSTLTFACTGTSTYALCLGTTQASDITGTCEPNLVCSIDYPQICGSPVLGVAATCPTVDDGTGGHHTTSTTTTESTTYSPLNHPQKYCRQRAQAGRFPVGNVLEGTCKQYIYCYLNGGTWFGAIYTCAGSTYFHSSAQLCLTSVPSRCA